MLGCFVRTLPFSAPHDAVLTMLVHATRWLSIHLYTFAYMSMHESRLLVCHPCFNTMKLWTSDLNLHLSLADTTFACLFTCLSLFLFACLSVCLLAFLFVCLSCGSSCLLPYAMLAMSVMLICFMPLSYDLCIFSFHCLSVGFLSLPLHIHTWSEDTWS